MSNDHKACKQTNSSKLTELQRRVTQQGATEAPFTGRLLFNQQQGIYSCLCCHQPLFSSEHKFDSGCGWPSFDRVIKHAIADSLLRYLPDNSNNKQRTEVRCGHCDAHLGHIFSDGPTETGQRYCINSSALCFIDEHSGEETAG